MALNRRKLSLIGGGIMILASILFIVSNRLPSWSGAKFASIKLTAGLWQSCLLVSDKWVCYEVPCSMMTSSQCTKMIAARATITITCALSIIVVLLFFACAALDTKATRGLILAIRIISLASLLIGILSLVLGISFATYSYGYSVGAAAIWGIMAAVLNMGGVVFTALI